MNAGKHQVAVHLRGREGVGLALEPVAEPGGGYLDRDDAVEPRVTRLPHLSHATRANVREDNVRAEAGAR